VSVSIALVEEKADVITLEECVSYMSAAFDGMLTSAEELGDARLHQRPQFDAFPPQPHPASEVRAAIERYLARTGPGFPKSVAAVVAAGKFHPLHEVGLRATAVAPPPCQDPLVPALEALETRMRASYCNAMERQRIDALLLPVAAFPPQLNGDRNVTPAGATTWIASGLHWPAAVVPMGYTYEDLPSGLQFIARPWQEPLLIGLAYAYEQATHHRKPPATVPALI
jgi:Asp-tRNA(Asn)/Glu-tRNA(Gln) amidotransferase A subunit family amidase